HDSNRKCLAFATRLSLCAKRCFNPQTPARFLNVAPHGLCHTPQRFVYVMPFGSNIDVARCGWEDGIKSNGKDFMCHCERV
ncbi:MAG: hypothetical protein K2N54_01910, partial [Helicobacter sp.]|nr:hypothetical protein [Helicobacter sp.]